MKLKFKVQPYQTLAVNSVVDCFKGQPNIPSSAYRVDPGKDSLDTLTSSMELSGFRNNDIVVAPERILENIQGIQHAQNIPRSKSVEIFKTIKKNSFVEDQSYSKKARKIAPYHLDVEMETGTGKTYCYIKTIFEMNKKYGWSKFIIVVPSVAIREGVNKSLQITAEHFKETYHKKIKFFIYNSKQLHNIEAFSSDAGINVMVINTQAFNARGKDNRRIYEVQDSFQSRRPIDVIRANKPILILDEPQKIEGEQTLKSLQEFNPLMVLRYSATHKTQHNKVHRLDAIDAYNQKLVKRIAVRGISVKGLSGTNTYLYLESIETSTSSPIARMEIEIKQKTGEIKRVLRKLKQGDNLYDISGNLDQYKGFIVSDIDVIKDFIEFSNGHKVTAGEATGDVNELALRRIQIREAIKAHFVKEQALFLKGIKVLTLFFIDEVAKYRIYNDSGAQSGEYATIFEEEYNIALEELLQTLFLDDNYRKHLNSIKVSQTHNGYFSIDKKNKRFTDPDMAKKTKETSDADAYDIILKDKERLLSFEEPIRFIFSHSALREGWDNPNVFVICALKHNDNTISRRQEVGRGLRIAVNQFGDRQDDKLTVHETNILTVIAGENYSDFVEALQRDISESLSERPRQANKEYFTGKILQTEDGEVTVTEDMAAGLERYLAKNDYIDLKDLITSKYHEDLTNEELVDLPTDLEVYKDQIIELIGTVFSEADIPEVINDRAVKVNQLNDNYHKKEFKNLWERINHKAVYSVMFESDDLIFKCIKTLNEELKVRPLQYTIVAGQQVDQANYEQLKSGNSFQLQDSSVEQHKHSIHSKVPYDLIGKISRNVQLTRQTVAKILSRIEKGIFLQYQINPEDFISEASRLIQEQKATCIIEHLSYDILNETYDTDIFTKEQSKFDFNNVGGKLKRHIYDYVATDSKVEKRFVESLDSCTDVVVYAKLPRGFSIPTPVGNYNPDWAIAFTEGSVKHVYFVAETKGSLSSLELRKIERLKIDCTKKFFDNVNNKIAPANITYDVVKGFTDLMKLVKPQSVEEEKDTKQ